MEGDFLRMVLGKPRHAGAVRIAKFLRPIPPVPAAGVPAEEMSVQRLELGVQLKSVTLLTAKLGKLGIVGTDPRESATEGAQAGARRGGPVDQRQGFKPRPLLRIPRLGQLRVDGVEQRAAGGRVRAETVRVGRKLRMNRTDRHGGRVMRGGGADEVAQGGEVADAAIPRAAEAIELYGQSPGPLVGSYLGERDATRGSDGQRDRRVPDF